MKLPVQIGDIWITRNNTEIVITGIVETDPMPVKAYNLCWTISGKYWDDDFDHSLDLITKK